MEIKDDTVIEDEKIDIESEDEITDEEKTSKKPSKDNDDENIDEKNEEEEKSPYDLKLEELEKEKQELKDDREKKDKIILQKTQALKEEREKNKKVKKPADVDEGDKPLTRESLAEFLDERDKKKEDRDSINTLTEDPKEQMVIKAYVDKGYSVEDAYLKANSHLILEHKRMEAEEAGTEVRESFLTRFSGGLPTGKKGQPKYMSNPILKEASKELTAEERKYLR